MKVKELKKILDTLDDEMEVEMEIVYEDGDSLAYGIDGHWIDEMYDDETDEDIQFLNLFFDMGKHKEDYG